MGREAAPLGGRALPAAWGLLAAAALALALDVYRSARVLLGGVPFLDQDGAPVASSYVRLGYLVQAVPPLELVLPLAALAVVVWLRGGVAAVRGAATALAALVAARGALTVAAVVDLALSDPPDRPGVQSLFSGNRLEELGPPLTGGLLVAGLALVVLQVLRTPAPAPDEQPEQDADVPVAGQAPQHEPRPDPEPDPEPEPDPYARFRRARG